MAKQRKSEINSALIVISHDSKESTEYTYPMNNKREDNHVLLKKFGPTDSVSSIYNLMR